MDIQVMTHRFHLSEKTRKRILVALREKCSNFEAAIEKLTLYVNTVVQKNKNRVVQCSLTLRSTSGQVMHIESRGPSLRSALADAVRRIKHKLSQKLKNWRNASKLRRIRSEAKLAS